MKICQTCLPRRLRRERDHLNNWDNNSEPPGIRKPFELKEFCQMCETFEFCKSCEERYDLDTYWICRAGKDPTKTDLGCISYTEKALAEEKKNPELTEVCLECEKEGEMKMPDMYEVGETMPTRADTQCKGCVHHRIDGGYRFTCVDDPPLDPDLTGPCGSYIRQSEVPVTDATTDNPIDPDHYSRLKPQPYEVIKSWELNYFLGSAVKYIARAGHKAGQTEETDLKKAMRYIELYLESKVHNR